MLFKQKLSGLLFAMFIYFLLLPSGYKHCCMELATSFQMHDKLDTSTKPQSRLSRVEKTASGTRIILLLLLDELNAIGKVDW